ncbi:hypothetical protein V6N12_048097 [Hibiscus sabdariffa]|uniref:Uncharacterized protein n=1 Tax=Hibiscus sabdariffa TaxID=183260 RepID=A0ABR2CUV7_9ROSI
MFGELSDYVFESTDDLGNVLWFKETSVLKVICESLFKLEDIVVSKSSHIEEELICLASPKALNHTRNSKTKQQLTSKSIKPYTNIDRKSKGNKKKITFEHPPNTSLPTIASFSNAKLESGCRWGLNGRGRVPLNTKADDKLIAAGTMEVEDPVEPVAVDRMGGCDGGDDVGT